MTSTLRAEFVVVNGSLAVRVHGIAQVGDMLTINAGKYVEKHVVKAVLWTGIAKDGRQASMVTSVMRQKSLSKRARVAAFGDRCTGRDSCRCFHCVS